MPQATPLGRAAAPVLAALRHPAKTALAGLLAAWACEALGLTQVLWAVISAIIVMQADIGGSLREGWYRLLGTLTGAALAIGVGLTVADPVWAMAAAVFLTVLVCRTVRPLGPSVRLAAITAAIVLLFREPGHTLLAVGAIRFAETALGIAVGLGVSLLVFPARATTGLRRGIAEALDATADFHAAVVGRTLRAEADAGGVDTARARLKGLRKDNRILLESARREPRSQRLADRLEAMLRLEQRLEEHVMAMEHADPGASGLLERMGPELERLAEAVRNGLRGVAAALRERTEPPGPEDLAVALETVSVRLLELRRGEATAEYPLDHVMDVHAFVTEMRILGRNTLRMAERVRRLDQD